MSDKSWFIEKTDPSPEALESANTVFTISNGYMALKGNLLEHRRGSYPGTFVAAVFDRADYFAFVRPVSYERRHFDPKYFDDAGMSPSIANLPDPLYVRVFVEGEELSFSSGKITRFRQTYDLRGGIYKYEYNIEQSGLMTRIVMQRFCDMRHPHRAYMRYEITPVDWIGTLMLHSGVDGSVRSNLKGDRQFEVVSSSPPAVLAVRTFLKGQMVHVAVGHHCREAGHTYCCDDGVYQWFGSVAKKGTILRLDKAIVISSDEDKRHCVAADVREELVDAMDRGFDQALADNAEWWTDAWRRCDVQIEGDDLAQTYLRFCLMHLISAAPRHSDKLSVPCKLLTGEWYQGTVFYDTDLYIEPFFLFNCPEMARSMLNYRHVCLGPGKEIAKRLGYKGAKLAWQAGPYGEEELGYWWRYTVTNIHLMGDVAYSLMQYWWATGDDEFMAKQGVETLTEFARFYVSRARKDEAGYHFDMVAGPDEGHNESTDNFYTNVLAKKTLMWAADVVSRFEVPGLGSAASAGSAASGDPGTSGVPGVGSQASAGSAASEEPGTSGSGVPGLGSQAGDGPAASEDPGTSGVPGLGSLAAEGSSASEDPGTSVSAEEMASWREVAEGLVLRFDPATKVYEQYEGFYGLKPLPEGLLDTRKEWWTPVFPYQAIHQPDVTMAMALLRDEFPQDVLRANEEYYRPRTMNFSSMSFVINSIVAKELGDIDRAYEQFMISAGEDLDETLTGRHDVTDGIHGTASGGAWLAAVSGFGGVFLSESGLSVNPRLPKHWKSLQFSILYRGQPLRLYVTQSAVGIVNGGTEAVELTVLGERVTLAAGENRPWPLNR